MLIIHLELVCFFKVRVQMIKIREFYWQILKFNDLKRFSKAVGSYMAWTVSSIKKFKGYRRHI